MSDLLTILKSRGFVHQHSETLPLEKAITAYVGYDCTAPSLHIGHLLSIMMLSWLQRTGHKPIVLMGGGTTRVGDPSGRDETRKILTLDDIEFNKNSIKRVFSNFISFGEGKTDAVMVDNAEWLAPLNYIEMLRDIGKHFSINRMLKMDSVKNRLDRDYEMSFIEFNYMILQSYDYVELSRRYGCNLQMGGSDQWGNIINGMDLGRRLGTPQLHALTCPLLTTASGAKMGKTAAGAVWLNADMLSAYDYWQYWRNTEDADVDKFLKLFTFLSLDEIAKLAALQGAEINEAKKVLATEATALIHGREAALRAKDTAQKTFAEGILGDDLPRISLEYHGIRVVEIFFKAGLVTSVSDARRQIKGAALKVNDVTVIDENATLSKDNLKEGVIKLSFGKKKHILIY